MAKSSPTRRKPRTRSESALQAEVLKALAHPIRMRLLTLLNQRVATPAQLASEIGEPLNKVSYHVRFLAKAGCVELVETRLAGPTVEHHYRAIARPWISREDWAEVPASARASVWGSVLAQIWDDVAAAVSQETFDAHEDRHLSRTTVVLDDKGWDAVATLLDDALERVLQIQSEAAERLVDAGDSSPETSEVVLMHFQLPSGSAGRDRRASPKQPKRRKPSK